MRIRCWGARGSIPVSGADYIKYGGDTTCLEIRTREDAILIVDAGSGIRRLGNSLLKEGRKEYTLIFTHAHWDHILGFPYFKPIYTPGVKLTIYGCPMKQGNMETLLAKTMTSPYYPVAFERLQAEINHFPACPVDAAIKVDGLEVCSIPLSHPNIGLGYKFKENGRTFVFLTDNELAHPHPGGRTIQEYEDFCRGADLLIHDAEYTEETYLHTKGWGHSTWKDALHLAIRAGVKSFGLFHHNQDSDDDHVDRLVAQCRQIINASSISMSCFGVTQDMILEL